MSLLVHVRNPDVSRVLQKFGFALVGSEKKVIPCNPTYWAQTCFGCDCCYKCMNCHAGRSGKRVMYDTLSPPDDVSRREAKSFVHKAMTEFGD